MTSGSIEVFETPALAAGAAATAVASHLRHLLGERGRAIGIFDGSYLPVTFFNVLTSAPGIDWTQVIAFQAGEYSGGDTVRQFLTEQLVLRVPIVEFHPLRGVAANMAAAVDNFTALLRAKPVDFAVLSFQYFDKSVEKMITLDSAILLECTTLFALGNGQAPQILRLHPNAHIFQTLPS